MFIIGLTGGIGSGKSAAAKILKELGLKVIDLDQITHELMMPSELGYIEIKKEFGEKYGLKPRAKIRSTAKIGTDPTIMLTGPVPVTEKILRESGMVIGDIDLFEVNEAFAVVPMAFMHEMGIARSKMNVNGGACALGHPIGASGARIIVTLLNALEKRGLNRGIAAICIGGGEGTAIAIERT